MSSASEIKNNGTSVTSRKKDAARKCAANAAVDDHLQNNQVVGIGSGTTIVFAVERIAEVVKRNGWSIKCIPTSYQAKQLILQHELTLWELENCSKQPDWAIDGADEVDANLQLIKGGGGCLLQEKVIDCAANRFVVVCDETKLGKQLGDKWHKGIPIEVLPMAWSSVKQKLQFQFGGEAALRESAGKLGPVVTDNGNFLLDWQFDKQHNWCDLDVKLHQIPGILETGLFINAASAVYVGKFDGSFVKLTAS